MRKLNLPLVLFLVSATSLFSPARVAALTVNEEKFYRSSEIHFFDNQETTPACSVGGVLGGDDNEAKVWNYFIGAGLTPEQAAGVMGNLSLESGFDPFNQENGSPWPTDGWGIAQWTGSPGRRTELRDAVIAELGSEYYVPTEEAGDMIGTPQEDALLAFQLRYLQAESEAREVRPQAHPVITQPFDAANEWEGLKQMSTVDEATYYWEWNFERPGVPGTALRLESANDIFMRLSGGAVPSAPSGGCGVSGSTEDASPDQDTSSLACPAGTTDVGVEQDYGVGRVPTVKIRLCDVKGVTQVNASIAQAALDMLNAAEKAGFVLTGDAWRSYDEQAALRVKNGCPDVDISPADSCKIPTAPAGNSMHEVALAIDFDNMCFPSATCPSSAAWLWLMENAGGFGFKKLSSEAWHWSPNGN